MITVPFYFNYISQEAYVEDLNGPALFESMFAEDAEASKLAQLPGVADLLTVYEEKFTKICMQLFDFGLGERMKRKEEIQSFFICMHQAVENNRNDSVQFINKFEKLKSKV